MIKPILFNTEMVRAILEGRKTVTRRVVKPQHLRVLDSPYHKEHPETPDKVLLERLCEPPYQLGQTLYVRETWAAWSRTYGFAPEIHYKADGETLPGVKWRPSIHMPREAARIFLRVKSVGVDRLQNIADEQALLEGVPNDGDYPLESPLYCPVCKGVGLVGALHPVSLGYMEVDCPHCDTPTKRFANLWGSTIKPSDRAIYGWDANPWVWVIQFERCERPKEVCPHGGAGEGGRLT